MIASSEVNVQVRSRVETTTLTKGALVKNCSRSSIHGGVVKAGQASSSKRCYGGQAILSQVPIDLPIQGLPDFRYILIRIQILILDHQFNGALTVACTSGQGNEHVDSELPFFSSKADMVGSGCPSSVSIMRMGTKSSTCPESSPSDLLSRGFSIHKHVFLHSLVLSGSNSGC